MARGRFAHPVWSVASRRNGRWSRLGRCRRRCAGSSQGWRQCGSLRTPRQVLASFVNELNLGFLLCLEDPRVVTFVSALVCGLSISLTGRASTRWADKRELRVELRVEERGDALSSVAR